MAKVEKKSVEDVISLINKKYGQNTLMSLGSNDRAKVKTISSGSLAIDKALGGGWAVGRIAELFAEPSAGKAQRLSSKVLTPNGWSTIGELEIGDAVCTPDGGDAPVIGLYPQGEKDVYRITLDDGSYTDATIDHLWEVVSVGRESVSVMTTGELIKDGLKQKNGRRKFKIPSYKPCNFKHNGLKVDPYLLGVLIAEGGLSTAVTFTTADEFVVKKVNDIIERDYPTLNVVKVSSKNDECITYRIRNKIGRKGSLKNPLLDDLRDLGFMGKRSYEKFIPKEYLINSIENRLSLLQALIDTDGSVGREGDVSYTTVSKDLSRDFEFLARSLGYRCSTSSRITKYTNGKKERVCGRRSYRTSLLSTNLDFSEATTPKKSKNLRTSLSNYTGRFIESIEKVGRDHCQCIMVGHPDHLYITDDFIVTHNTTICLHAIAEVQKTGGRVAYIDSENAMDVNYAKTLGVDVDNLLFCQPGTAEEALQILVDLIDTGEFKLIVVDSVAAMTPAKVIENDVGDSTIGLLARLMSQELPKIANKALSNECTILMVNQIRQKIGGGYGGGITTPGGESLKFYASQRVHLFKGSLASDHGEAIGNESWCRVVKNKVAPPFREARYSIKFGTGLDKMKELIDFAVEYGIISKGGSWYSYGDTKLGQGVLNVIALLEDNPELTEEIEIKLKQRLEDEI